MLVSRGFSHVGLCSSDPKRDEDFWTRVCSAKVSDWIGDAALLRIDEVHHRIALFPSSHGGIQHINHQVECQDDIMRSWYLLKEKGRSGGIRPGTPTQHRVHAFCTSKVRTI